MRLSLQTIVAWLAALIGVASLYVHNLLGVPSSEVTPLMAGALASVLAVLALLGVASGDGLWGPERADRKTSVAFLCLYVALATCSMILGQYDRPLSLNDIGLFSLEVLMPILLFFCGRRRELIDALGCVSVVFAFMDLAANGLEASGVASGVVEVSGREGSQYYGIHYLGVAGSSFGEGLVSFVATSFLAMAAQKTRGVARLAIWAMLLMLLGGLFLASSRIYIAISIVTVVLITVRQLRRWPPFLTVVAISAGMIIKTFTADWENFDDTLRRDLILDALDRAGRFPLVGTGAFYRDSQSGVANYQALHDAGVTESGFLELSIAYGMVGATFLLLSCLTAACAHRERPNFRAVAVAAMTGSLALTNPLGSLLGSLFFFCCMIWIQCDEPDAERRQYRRSAMLADRARGLAV